MLDDAHQQDLIKRLNRIEGQVRGIKNMVEEPRLCAEILQQLAAAEAALHKVSGLLFHYHVRECVPASLSKGGSKQVKELAELVDIFSHFSR